MSNATPLHGIGTLMNHVAEGQDPSGAEIAPIYQSSTFAFPSAAAAAAVFKGEQQGYIYTRFDNPNSDQVTAKLAALEGFDLMRAHPELPLEQQVAGRLFCSGMAAITGAILPLVKSGQTILAQQALYSASYNFLNDLSSRFNLNVVWVSDLTPAGWEQAFTAHPQAVLAFAETPANPALAMVDLAAAAEIAHRYGAWLVVDNTFATPYCQRPFNLGADVVIHSTTKYLCGHGQIIGGAVLSTHLDYVNGPLFSILKTYGGSPSPFDAWLTNTGLKTFELRMQRHCSNALQIAAWLEQHPKVARVYYPGLPSHPDHVLALRQLVNGFGGMVSFELKGGLQAGIHLMDHLHLLILAPTLGNTESLVQHPASMSHSGLPAETRRAMGISDGLVRFSVGIENPDDLIADLDQALAAS